MRMLVVGSVALDTVRTPHGRAESALGGSAAYFAVAARHFGNVGMVAVVGEDFPDAHMELFRRHGIDVSGLERVPGTTFRWVGEYAPGFVSRTTLATELNVFAGWNPWLGPRHREAEFVFLANIHPGLQSEVLDQVARPRLVVLDTMNYWIERAREELLNTLRRVDVVLLNDEEACMLTGEWNLTRAALGVLGLGPATVVVKKGEHGATVISREFTLAVPAYPVETLLDPTGAGDSFAGGFVGYLSTCADPRREDEIRRAAAYGVVLASFTVESFSLDRLASVTREELEARLGRFRDLVRF